MHVYVCSPLLLFRSMQRNKVEAVQTGRELKLKANAFIKVRIESNR